MYSHEFPESMRPVRGSRDVASEGPLMEPDGRPLDSISAAALVLRVIDDIDQSSEEERDELLCALLSAAWGSIGAQNH